MKKEIFINPQFSHLSEIISQIPSDFYNIGESIYSGRNEVRKADIQGTTITIKYFKKISLANKFIYRYIRKSKAQRAYEHSLLILNKGFSTPSPIAYINCYKNGMLSQSYYLCLYSSDKPLETIFSLPVQESVKGLKAFGEYTHRLHKAGIFHDDFNIGNILYSSTDKGYEFNLIDNNRMKFRRYNYWRGIKNMNRLKVPLEYLGIIAEEYSKAANISNLRTLNAMTFSRIIYLDRVALKKGLKSIKKLFA